MNNIISNIKKIKTSIIAIGYQPSPNQITIIGSGFSITEDGKILSAAHIYNQVPKKYVDNIYGMAMTSQEDNGLEHYKWLKLEKIKKDDINDLIIYQIDKYEETLLKRLELGDSNRIEVGEEVFFIGFPYAAQLINDGFGITLIVNKGIISNVKRDGINKDHPINWIVIDAISNLGNSGCPLIDIYSNKVIGIMTISFRTKSFVIPNLDIREPMHIAGAKPINLAKNLF